VCYEIREDSVNSSASEGVFPIPFFVCILDYYYNFDLRVSREGEEGVSCCMCSCVC